MPLSFWWKWDDAEDNLWDLATFLTCFEHKISEANRISLNCNLLFAKFCFITGLEENYDMYIEICQGTSEQGK